MLLRRTLNQTPTATRTAPIGALISAGSPVVEMVKAPAEVEGEKDTIMERTMATYPTKIKAAHVVRTVLAAVGTPSPRLAGFIKVLPASTPQNQSIQARRACADHGLGDPRRRTRRSTNTATIKPALAATSISRFLRTCRTVGRSNRATRAVNDGGRNPLTCQAQSRVWGACEA